MVGFFVKDFVIGDVFLMYSGKVGGGCFGIGKFVFFVWLKVKFVEVFMLEGSVWNGIVVVWFGDEDFVEWVWVFVMIVYVFKERVVIGELDMLDFK